MTRADEPLLYIKPGDPIGLEYKWATAEMIHPLQVMLAWEDWGTRAFYVLPEASRVWIPSYIRPQGVGSNNKALITYNYSYWYIPFGFHYPDTGWTIPTRMMQMSDGMFKFLFKPGSYEIDEVPASFIGALQAQDGKKEKDLMKRLRSGEYVEILTGPWAGAIGQIAAFPSAYVVKLVMDLDGDKFHIEVPRNAIRRTECEEVSGTLNGMVTRGRLSDSGPSSLPRSRLLSGLAESDLGKLAEI